MSLIILILGGVPPYSVTAGGCYFFSRFSLSVTHVAVFLTSIDEFPFYYV